MPHLLISHQMRKLPAHFIFLFIFPFFYFFAVSAVVFLLTLFLISRPNSYRAVEEKMVKAPVYTLFSKTPPILGAFTSSFDSSDARPAIIEQFFAKYKSPLAPYGEKFIEVSDKYNLPWELLPAITMQESNGGKKIPNEDCLNPFGWGIHSRGTLCFSTWEGAIEKVAEGLKKYYVDQGLVTTKEIMSKYNPTSYNRDGSWGNGVEYFVDEIRDFSTIGSN